MNQPFNDRRERRIATKKAHILQTASNLFAEKGFHRTTTKDIAQAADISEGTLYNYFEDKDDLLLGIVSFLGQSQNLVDLLPQALSVDARDYLDAMLHGNKEFMFSNQAMMQSVFSEILVDPVLRDRYYRELVLPGLTMLEEHLLTRIEHGQIKPIDERHLSRILFGMVIGLFVLKVIGDPWIERDWDAIVDVIGTVFFDGLSLSDKGSILNIA